MSTTPPPTEAELTKALTGVEPERMAIHPAYGTFVNLDDATNTIAVALDELGDLYDRLHAYRQALADELIARLDKANHRSAGVGEWKLTTNAPTVEEYDLGRLREELERLVADDVLEDDVVGRVIGTPPPKPQAPTLRKGELNKLKRHPDSRVARAIGAARTITGQRRTLKVERVDGRS